MGGGYSLWHWLVLLLLFGLPLLILFVVIRAAVRSGTKAGIEAAKHQPPDTDKH